MRGEDQQSVTSHDSEPPPSWLDYVDDRMAVQLSMQADRVFSFVFKRCKACAFSLMRGAKSRKGLL